MVGGGGLKRTVSRGNLWDPSSSISNLGGNKSTSEPAEDAKPAEATTDAATTDVADHQRKPIAEPTTAKTSPHARPPILKRSHSFGAMDRPDNYGQESVENISGKVVLPGKAIGQRPPQAREVVCSREAGQVETHERKEPSAGPPDEHDEDDASICTDISQRSTSSPGSQLTDDLELKPEARERVDYFSHNWREGDIADSWRYIISRKRREEMANAARLENASWRMWAKAKYKLKTVSPTVVNWLKDYDVTWLYGPLFHSPSVSSTDSPAVSPAPDLKLQERQESAKPAAQKPKLKPILKKKSMAQLMLEDSAPPEANYMRHYNYRDGGSVSGRKHAAQILNRQYNHDLDKTYELEESSDSEPRHVHFNDRVEQCLALDPQETLEASNNIEDEAVDGEDEDEDEGYESDDSSNGGLFLGVRRPSSIDSLSGAHIIQTLPATTLKIDEDEELKKKSEQSLVQHGSRRPGFNANYNYHAVYEPTQDASYKIMDPNIKPVDLQAKPPGGEIEGPKRRIRPAASFG